MGDCRIGREHRSREVSQRLGGVARAEEHLSYCVEVAVVMAAGEEDDVLGTLGIVACQCKAALAPGP
jgi:hypothetical protein